MSEAILEMQNVEKRFGGVRAIDQFSLKVEPGMIYGLIGPNGAGKTTTFYMAVGLVTPNEGRIFLNDLDITKFPVYKRAQHGLSLIHI